MQGLKSSVSKYADESSIHGLAELKGENACGKIIWLVCMSAVVVVCTVILRQLIEDALSEPTVSSITEILPPNSVPLVFYPRSFKYNIPQLPSLTPESIDEFYRLLDEHNTAVEACTADNCPKEDKGTWIEHYDFTEADVKEIQEELQKFIFVAELHNSQAMINRPTAWLENMIRLSGLQNNALSVLGSVIRFGNWSSFQSLVDTLGVMHLNDVDGDIHDFYKDQLAPDNFHDLFWHATFGGDGTPAIDDSFDLVFSNEGLGYKINVSLSTPYQYWNKDANIRGETQVSFECGEQSGHGITWIHWAMGTRFDQLLDLKPSDSDYLHCSSNRVFHLKLLQKSFEAKFCSQAKSTCQTACLIGKARKTGGCLPYLSVPHLRKDVPFCTYPTGYPNGSAFVHECNLECQNNGYRRPCSDLQVTSVVENREMYNDVIPGVAHLLIDVKMDRGGIQHIHLASKYTAADVLSGIGGILGIGFGMSILSLFQLMYCCCKTCFTSGLDGRVKMKMVAIDKRNDAVSMA